MTATELVNVNVEAKLSFQSNCALKSPVLALFGGQLLLGRFGDWLVIFDCGFVFVGHSTILNAAAITLQSFIARSTPATKLVHIDIQVDLF